MKRGLIRKPDARLLTVWVPNQLLPLLDRGVDKTDSDRSKFVRTAIREKLARHGIEITEQP